MYFDVLSDLHPVSQSRYAYGVMPYSEENQKKFIDAVVKGDLASIKALMSEPELIDINQFVVSRKTPFIVACQYNHKDIVEYFVEHLVDALACTGEEGRGTLR